eukprot:2362464-Pyramimonas_sp.AAC.1
MMNRLNARLITFRRHGVPEPPEKPHPLSLPPLALRRSGAAASKVAGDGRRFRAAKHHGWGRSSFSAALRPKPELPWARTTPESYR